MAAAEEPSTLDVVRKTISTPFIWSQLPISVITVHGTKQFMSSYEMPFGFWKDEKMRNCLLSLSSLSWLRPDLFGGQLDFLDNDNMKYM